MNPIDAAIVLDEAKKYTDSQRLAHIETKSIICGKNFYGADRIDFSAIQGVPEFMFVKISDKILTPDDFKSIVFYQKTVDNHGGVAEGQRDILSEMTFTEPVEFDGVTAVEGYLGGTDGTLYVIILHTDDPGVNDGKPHTAGTYVLRLKTENAEVYCVSVTTETIHPIDPKFLPGVCLPVVELSGTLTTGDAVAEEDCAKLKAAHGSNLPVVIKSDAIINNTRYADSALIYNSGTLPDNGVMFFVASLGTIQLQILSNDDGETWNAYAIS